MIAGMPNLSLPMEVSPASSMRTGAANHTANRAHSTASQRDPMQTGLIACFVATGEYELLLALSSLWWCCTRAVHNANTALHAITNDATSMCAHMKFSWLAGTGSPPQGLQSQAPMLSQMLPCKHTKQQARLLQCLLETTADTRYAKTVQMPVATNHRCIRCTSADFAGCPMNSMASTTKGAAQAAAPVPGLKKLRCSPRSAAAAKTKLASISMCCTLWVAGNRVQQPPPANSKDASIKAPVATEILTAQCGVT